MRIILNTILTIMLFSGPALSIEPDKEAHLRVSAYISLPIYAFCYATKQKHPALCAFGMVMALGAIKETTDSRFDWGDMAANAVGSGAPLTVLYLTFE